VRSLASFEAFTFKPSSLHFLHEVHPLVLHVAADMVCILFIKTKLASPHPEVNLLMYELAIAIH
jgi:hypothetical protein